MKKLVRYHSFEALKGDIKTDNLKSSESKARQVEMEKFFKLSKIYLSFVAACVILHTIVPAMPLHDAHFGRFSLFMSNS